MTNINEIIYPISITGYVPEWGHWEIPRELKSNAKDTSASYSMTMIDNDLVIEDQGDGLAIRQLLMGVSEKSSGSAIGQFGEGLKLALLVATRLGYRVDVYSGNKHIVNSKALIADVECLRLSWTEIEPIKGTRIVIHDWKGEDYSYRFIDNPEEDGRIIARNEFGDIINEPALFVKGVWVMDLESYQFGYNINSIKMGRDRSAVSEWEVQSGIGRIWRNVESSYAWKNFFLASCEHKGERNIALDSYSMSDAAKTAMQKGFISAYGANAVIKTSDDNKRESEHRGAKVVDSENFGYYLADAIKAIVKTDKQFIQEKGGIKYKVVKPSTLTKEQKENLAIIKRMAKKCSFSGNIEVAELPEGRSHYDPNSDTIRMHIKKLNDTFNSKRSMAHELSHAVYQVLEDNTEDHVIACNKISALLFD